MPLTIQKITKLDVWNRFLCPVCDNDEFVSLHNSSVWCKECNARFSIRYTAGDPGYVVDCHSAHCSRLKMPDGSIKDYAAIAKERMPKGYAYLIDKEGDYYSGWLDNHANKISGCRKAVHHNDTSVVFEEIT